MSYSFALFDRILNGDLKPWLQHDISENKFREEYAQVTKFNFKFQPLYNLDFVRPIGIRRKFFKRIIENEAIAFLNSFHKSLEDSDLIAHKEYLINNLLLKELPDIFNQIKSKISKFALFPKLYLPAPDGSMNTAADADSSYILHLLKHTVVWIYMEVQEKNKEYLIEDYLEENEIYLEFFGEECPIPSHLITAENIGHASPVVIRTQETAEPSFKSLTYDFREAANGILSYDEIIKNPTYFARFEEKLFQNGYIKSDHKFSDEHGLKNGFAAIYHILINKGYFNSRVFNPNRKISQTAIRKFLDYRYFTNTDQQFRKHIREPELLHKFLQVNIWIRDLPTL